MRRSGILLHPTSLPGLAGIGSIGAPAREFVRFLAAAQQTVWQMLPLVPTDDGGCPYNSTSAMASNTRLIDLHDLCKPEFGCILTWDDLNDAPRPEREDMADFEMAGNYKNAKLALALDRLKAGNDDVHKGMRKGFEDFCKANAKWLDDFALFDVLQATREEGPLWINWPKGLRDRDKKAIAKATQDYAADIELRKFAQYIFRCQWDALRNMAREHHIKIMGDVPIFVSHNSVDVWCHRDLFELDANGFPGSVSGAPPDCFAEEGQLWGNPLYNWKKLAETGYEWWIDRLTALNNLVDIVRIDHFRGFEAFWSILATEKTAVNGHWVKGPGIAFFNAVAKALPNLEIIAEDLGVITEEVDKLRKDAGFPGMRVIQFGFPYHEANDHHALHMHTLDSVVYCGTHDNDTTVGWYLSLNEGQRDKIRRYLSIDGNEIAWQMMRAAQSSCGELCIVTVQDLLSLGSEARMNVPGLAKGNWTWRFTYALPGWIADRLRDITELYGRAPWQQTVIVPEVEVKG
ncbi:MAG: 4-alpha-glucanotransferase [Proteobacteria bacterium]|nr:4-alpha-glucanotransferase [Pseudomonadota bacterium]